MPRQIYRFEIQCELTRRGGNIVYDVRDALDGSARWLLEWNPQEAVTTVDAQKMHGIAQANGAEIFSDRSSYCLAVRPESAKTTLNALRQIGLFSGAWPGLIHDSQQCGRHLSIDEFTLRTQLDRIGGKIYEIKRDLDAFRISFYRPRNELARLLWWRPIPQIHNLSLVDHSLAELSHIVADTHPNLYREGFLEHDGSVREPKRSAVVEQYNHVRRSPGNNSVVRDVFLARFSPCEVSLINQFEVRADPASPAAFQLASRGLFFVVEHNQQYLLFPHFSTNLSSDTVQTVFEYQGSSNAQLAQPATLIRRADLYILNSRGRIKGA